MMNQLETMTLKTAIRGRRSIRQYVPGVLDESALAAVLDAAIHAPTAVHQQPWRFVIVQDPGRLKLLSDRAKALFAPEVEKLHHAHPDSDNPFRHPAFDVFYGAGTLIVICAPEAAPFAEADCWLAAQNLMLTAYSLGLGTCVIGSAVKALNEPEFKKALGILPEYIAIAPIIVGKPGGPAPDGQRDQPVILARR